MNEDNQATVRNAGTMRSSSLLRAKPGLFDLVPEQLAARAVEAALAQLDRLAIWLFPQARTTALRDLAKRDQSDVDAYALRSALGCALVRLTRFAQTGTLQEGSVSVFEDMTGVWEATYSRAIDSSAIEGLRMLEADALRCSEIDIVMRAALARRRITAGEAVSLSALAILGDVSEEEVRSTIAPAPRSTVTPEIARAWLRMRSVPGF